MRIFFTIISAVFIFSNISAQQLTNGSFEWWQDGNPVYWSTSHSCISESILESQNSNVVYQGASYSLKMMSGNIPSPADIQYPGFAHYGTAEYDATAKNFDMYGMAFAYRPDSIQFAYLYTPAGHDQANVSLQLYKGNISNIIGTVNVNLGATSSFGYKLVTLPVSYVSDLTPDSISLTFYSGSLAPVTGGSVMYLDAVNMIYGSSVQTGIETLSAGDIRVYPNPATSALYFNVSDKLVGNIIRVYDILGNKVMDHEITGMHDAVSLSAMHEGVYIYHIIDRSDNTVSMGKFTKE